MDRNAKSSKCWNCRYGICTQQNVAETLIMPTSPAHKEEWQETNSEEDNFLEKTVNQTGIMTICYFLPIFFKDSELPTFQASFVEECSRYKPEA